MPAGHLRQQQRHHQAEGGAHPRKSAHGARGAAAQNCDPGFYSAEAETETCTACEAGRYGDTPGTSPGARAPRPLAVDCDRAPRQALPSAWTASRASSALRCSSRRAIAIASSPPLCADGRPSSPAQCTECPAGTFSNRYGAPECTRCGPGEHQNVTGRCRAHTHTAPLRDPPSGSADGKARLPLPAQARRAARCARADAPPASTARSR
jgi:hypothetical protein